MDKKQIIADSKLFRREYIVYFLIADEKIIYVGKSSTGIARIYTHYVKEVIPFTHYTIEKSNEKDYSNLEKKYIKRFQPKYNSVYTLKEVAKLEDVPEEHLGYSAKGDGTRVFKYKRKPKRTSKRKFRSIMKSNADAWAQAKRVL